MRSQVEVPAPSEGRLTSIAVKPRDMVQKGQLLATLDQRAAELAVRSAKAGQQAAAGRLGQVQTALDAARRALERTRQLKAKGLASDQDLAQAESDYASARAAVEAAQADRKLATENVAAAQLGQSMGAIVAPVSGIVLHAPDRVGAAVSPARGPLFVIAEPLSTMRVEAPVSETEIAQIAPGHKAEVIVQALPGKDVPPPPSISIGIEPQRESGVVAYPVTLLVDNPDNLLLPGMSARVRMEVARAENALSVREAALRFAPPDAEPATVALARVALEQHAERARSGRGQARHQRRHVHRDRADRAQDTRCTRATRPRSGCCVRTRAPANRASRSAASDMDAPGTSERDRGVATCTRSTRRAR